MECGDRRGWGEGKMVLSHFSTEERNGVWGPKGLGRGKYGFKPFFYRREKWSVGTEGVGEREKWF